MPLQFGHAPSEFALNSESLTLLALANDLRSESSIPVEVAGFERFEPRMAHWSTLITSGCAPREPWLSDDLPEPATPVTTVSTPSGASTLTFLRLCSFAP